MADMKVCPKCGDNLPADAPAGICPKCLRQKGLESTVGVEAPSAALPAAGQLFGSYRIGRLLGQGGMGAVYDAEHTESGRHVALKVLNHQLESPEHRQRFLREGRLAASINHPNNVYIYGTEEINATPVIAMELARGGTLQDRVKRDGPLPVGEAVDMILQIIAGLEAAEVAGVLHRDVKPSNCFLDADGNVKIGDFGLSILTSPRAETNLTQSGVFLGTPAFASPEQLRGDELDVRSDIYSVGMTLYYLLTGRTPFEAKQMVQLLATVLERPAPSPAIHRPETPSGLARVVLRCLAKQSSHRFKSYDELRHALLPYESAAPTPATLGFRVLASGFDGLVIAALAALLPLIWIRDIATWHAHFDTMTSPGPSVNSTLMLVSVVGILLHLMYFTLLEGVWGATAGKAICRLRVVRKDRESPGLPRAALRATMYCAAGWLPWWLVYAYDSEAGMAAYADSDWTLLGISLAATVLMFSTVRRRNGYAGVHELASGTCVVRTQSRERRPKLSLPDEQLPEMRDEQRIGPYHVLGILESGPTQEVILAYDTRLLRKVWIRKCLPDAAPIPQQLCELARIGRLRWLNGERSAQGGWDAYEAPSGKPLLSLMSTRHPWDAVRFWLLDLAQELSAGLSDNTAVSVLALERVWITADGRAKLLDFPAPGLDGESRDGLASRSIVPDASAAAIFLKCLAIAGLEGSIVPPEEAKSRQVLTPIPLSARTLLNALGGPEKSTIPTKELQIFTQRPASVSQEKRVGALAACWLMPLTLAAYGMSQAYSERQFLHAYPEVGKLSGFVNYYHLLDERDERREAVEINIVHEFRSMIRDAKVWSDPAIDGFFVSRDRQLLEGFVNSHSNLTKEQIAGAQMRLAPVHLEIMQMGWSPNDELFSLPLHVIFLRMFLFALVVFVIVPSLLSALLIRNSLLLRWLDVAIVTSNGAPASRLRILWRNTSLWVIVLLALGLLLFFATKLRGRIGLGLILYGVVTMFTAEQGLHDQLARTRLVPR